MAAACSERIAAFSSGMQIRFGQAMIPLTGPWKFHTGDDMRWADPKFDDSSWGTMDLTPNAVDPNTGLSGFAPGWTARGYAGYSGYAWYRLRVNVVQQNAQGNTQGADEALAVSMPSLFDAMLIRSTSMADLQVSLADSAKRALPSPRTCRASFRYPAQSGRENR
jgi:hypothetical protein